MKKALLSIMLSIVAVLGLCMFGACDDGDVSVVGKTYEFVDGSFKYEFDSTVPQEIKDLLSATQFHVNDGLKGSTFQFNENGTVTITEYEEEEVGEGSVPYTQNGNKITFFIPNRGGLLITIDGDILHCSATEEGMTQKMDYKLKA